MLLVRLHRVELIGERLNLAIELLAELQHCEARVLQRDLVQARNDVQRALNPYFCVGVLRAVLVVEVQQFKATLLEPARRTGLPNVSRPASRGCVRLNRS